MTARCKQNFDVQRISIYKQRKTAFWCTFFEYLQKVHKNRQNDELLVFNPAGNSLLCFSKAFIYMHFFLRKFFKFPKNTNYFSALIIADKQVKISASLREDDIFPYEGVKLWCLVGADYISEE